MTRPLSLLKTQLASAEIARRGPTGAVSINKTGFITPCRHADRPPSRTYQIKCNKIVNAEYQLAELRSCLHSKLFSVAITLLQLTLTIRLLTLHQPLKMSIR